MNDDRVHERARLDRRLFVPLAKKPYEWFLSGVKSWEVRRQRGAFNLNTVTIGRRVELRLGYRPIRPSLWGTITQIMTEDNVSHLLQKIPYRSVVPEAENYDNARRQIQEILRIGPVGEARLIAFHIDLDDPNRVQPRIYFDSRYLDLITDGQKTTTIRRPTREVRPGPASFCFGSEVEILVAITAVTYMDAQNLTDHDAQRDGFSDRRELLSALGEHYPGFQLSETVLIVEFKCLL